MNPIATLSKGGVDLNQGKEYGSLAGISDQEAEELCQALRQRVIQVVSQTGGHLASNLGAVELTVALHRVYDTSKDRLVFDVGHQCYVHKMLTGRNGRMETLRAFGGIAGFPKPSESKHDACIAGHASTAVSTALGMAIAMNGMDKCITVAMVGKVLDDDEILKSIENGKKAFGFVPEAAASVIPVIMRGIMG